jgi:mRNA interferase MazF
MRISVAGPAIRRGEIWWTEFGLATGGQIRKSRPAIVVSNDEANAFLNRVQVVPVTSNVQRVYPSEALVKIDNRHCKAMADQIATADKARLRQRIGRVSKDELKAIETAMRKQLAL